MVAVPATSAKYTALRVIATVLPIVLAMGATAAVFLAIPAVTGAATALVKETQRIILESDGAIAGVGYGLNHYGTGSQDPVERERAN